MDDGALVRAATCHHQVQLPRYSSKDVTAAQLARCVQRPQYISASFHGTHKESLEQKQCNLRLILSALEDLGLPCVLSGDLNLKHNEIKEIYLKHGFRRADGFCAQFLCMETALYPQMPTSPSPTSAHLLTSGTNCKFRAAIFTDPESSPGTEIDHVLTFKPKGSSWRLEVQNLVRIDDPEKVLDHPILTFEVMQSPR